MPYTTQAEQPATHYGCIQTLLPTCSFPNSIVDGCRHVFDPDLDPSQYDREVNGSEFQPVFTPPGQLEARNEVLNLVSCDCKTGCKMAVCSCVKFTLACSEFCKCMGQASCQNPMKTTIPDSDDSGK